MSGKVEYHLEELRRARSEAEGERSVVPELSPDARILDIGCGAGQTLIANYPGHVTYGIDPDEEALRLGRTLTDRVRFVRAAAESLPFVNGHFDAVMCRVALPYTDIRVSLAEMRRVLKQGGQLWITLHTFKFVVKQARRTNWRGKVFFAYIVLNSLSFHFFQRHFRFPGKSFESFQTDSGISRALRREGFEQIRIVRNTDYLITARRG